MTESNPLTGYPSIDKPWLKYYSDEAINKPVPECTIYDFMWENNKDYPKDTALVYFNRKISYGELFDNIEKTAKAFTALGVKPHDIVTVALPSIPEALYCIYALNRLGAVANMIHPLAGKDETIFYLNEVKSRVAVLFDRTYETIADDLGKTSVIHAIVASPADSLPAPLKIAYNLKVKKPALDGSVSINWKTFIRGGKGVDAKTVKKDCHEMAILSHTGGTTGNPKGCMITDCNINAEIWQIGMSMDPHRQECMMVVLPPFVNYSLTNGMLEPLAFGMKLVLIPKYEPLEFADYVEKHKVNHVNTIPAYCEAMLQIPDIEKKDLSSLMNVFYGGEGMTEEAENSVNLLLKKCGCNFALKKGLGMTEVTSAATVTFDNVNDFESVGVPLSKMNCKIVQPDTFDEVTYGEQGEVCFYGPTLMLGYYENKQETDDLLRVHPDGKRWLHTGDLGYINEDGVLFITGRIKRIIMTKGLDGQVTKMFPDRIEKALYAHQAVELCCVIGVPDEDRINYPKAFVVLKADYAESESLTQEIISVCQENLPGYMVPNEIEYHSSLPRTERGKIDYRALEEMAQKA